MESISSNIKIATDSLTLAKANQEKNANRSCRDLVFDIGDQVLLNSYYVNLASQALCPSKKLQHRFIGPYPIVAKVSPIAYKLALPPDLHIHPVFHVSLFCPYLLPSSVPHRPLLVPPPPAISVDDHLEFEVEHILDVCHRYCRREFLIKWVGYLVYDMTWEPESNLPNAADVIRDFLAPGSSPDRGGSDVMVLHGIPGGIVGLSAAQHMHGIAEHHAAQHEIAAKQVSAAQHEHGTVGHSMAQ